MFDCGYATYRRERVPNRSGLPGYMHDACAHFPSTKQLCSSLFFFSFKATQNFAKSTYDTRLKSSAAIRVSPLTSNPVFIVSRVTSRTFLFFLSKYGAHSPLNALPNPRAKPHVRGAPAPARKDGSSLLAHGIWPELRRAICRTPTSSATSYPLATQWPTCSVARPPCTPPSELTSPRAQRGRHGFLTTWTWLWLTLPPHQHRTRTRSHLRTHLKEPLLVKQEGSAGKRCPTPCPALQQPHYTTGYLLRVHHGIQSLHTFRHASRAHGWVCSDDARIPHRRHPLHMRLGNVSGLRRRCSPAGKPDDSCSCGRLPLPAARRYSTLPRG